MYTRFFTDAQLNSIRPSWTPYTDWIQDPIITIPDWSTITQTNLGGEKGESIDSKSSSEDNKGGTSNDPAKEPDLPNRNIIFYRPVHRKVTQSIS